jgi:hypothetical protein
MVINRRNIVAVMMIGVWFAGARVAPLSAAEPRPWLCRDKPVFSSEKPMAYEAANRGSARWLLTFMHFDPAGGHDGFTVIATRAVSGRIEGRLEAGQWYTVALYREGAHWICPGSAGGSDQPARGVISNLCFGEDPGACPLELTVRPADSSAATSHR